MRKISFYYEISTFNRTVEQKKLSSIPKQVVNKGQHN